MAIESVEIQPGETLDFDADFSKFLNRIGDTGSSKSATVQEDGTGITLSTSTLMNSTSAHDVSGVTNAVVKCWFTSGTKGTYKATVRLTTTGGRTIEYEFNVKVKER